MYVVGVAGSNVHHLVPAFAPEVLEAVRAHVDRDPHNEVGGILVGRRRHGHSPMITASIEAAGAEGDVTSLTFTHEAWAGMLAELDVRYPDDEIIGWYHSHPGHGIFLSEHDRFIHRNFFGAPWHVAFVVDPQRGEEGLFAWTKDGLEIVLGNEREDRHHRAAAIEIDEADIAVAEPPLTVLPTDVGPEQPASPTHGAESASRARRRGRRPEGLVLPALAGLVMGLIVGFALQAPG